MSVVNSAERSSVLSRFLAERYLHIFPRSFRSTCAAIHFCAECSRSLTKPIETSEGRVKLLVLRKVLTFCTWVKVKVAAEKHTLQGKVFLKIFCLNITTCNAK